MKALVVGGKGAARGEVNAAAATAAAAAAGRQALVAVPLAVAVNVVAVR